MSLLKQTKPAIQNTYGRIVKPQGNQAAQAIIQKVFEPQDSLWRGLGNISKSGFQLKKEYETWDAWKRFNLPPLTNTEPKGCQWLLFYADKKSQNNAPYLKLFASHKHRKHRLAPAWYPVKGHALPVIYMKARIYYERYFDGSWKRRTTNFRFD